MCGKEEGAVTKSAVTRRRKGAANLPSGVRLLPTYLLFPGALVSLDLPSCLLARDPPFLLEVPAAQAPLDYLRTRGRFCRRPGEIRVTLTGKVICALNRWVTGPLSIFPQDLLTLERKVHFTSEGANHFGAIIAATYNFKLSLYSKPTRGGAIGSLCCLCDTCLKSKGEKKMSI